MATHEPFPTWINGRLFAPGEGVVPASDAGFLSGLGVFDGLLFEGGHRFFEERHLERFAHAVAAVGIALPLPWDPALALDEFCRALGGRDAFVRLTATRGDAELGPTLAIGARAIERPPLSGARLVLHRMARPAFPLAAIKTTSRIGYALAREHARRAGAYDALLATPCGELLEGTVCNAFLLVRGVLVTPAVERGCLPGIVRGIVIEEALAAGLAVEERRVDLAELAVASEVFVTGTAAGVAGVVAVDGAPGPGSTGRGPAGPWTLRLAGALRAREQADRAAAAAG